MLSSSALITDVSEERTVRIFVGEKILKIKPGKPVELLRFYKFSFFFTNESTPDQKKKSGDSTCSQ